MSSIQLTLLWEHILKTRQLPESLCPRVMFTEFLERLRDPEWQVRQHALRVLVDVLVIMRNKADLFMGPIVPLLSENLAHHVPAVRKGALDCIRVYLTETEQPDAVMLMILDTGLKQRMPAETYRGRLTCAVMLSLPALIQVILHTKQKSYIVQHTVGMLLENMGHAAHQEVVLKVLKKIGELLGKSEFEKYMPTDTYQEFKLLCKSYGICNEDKDVSRENSGKCKLLNSESSTNTWRLMASKTQPLPNCRHSSEVEESEDNRFNNKLDLNCSGKIIMETEIKINDDTLTMRILEAKSDDDISVTNIDERPTKPLLYSTNNIDDEIVYGRLNNARNIRENVGLVQLLSDSDDLENGNQKVEAKEDIIANQCFSAIVTPSTPLRTSKRVTFGGEIVKMRTPDSDVHSNNNVNKQESQLPANQQKAFVTIKSEQQSSLVTKGSSENRSLSPTPTIIDLSKTTALSLDIPNDNTKPLVNPKNKNQQHYLRSPLKFLSSSSPKPNMDKDGNISSLKRLSLSPVDGIISPRTVHKEVEVLHNLQRDPSPNRSNKLGRPSTPQIDNQPAENLTNVENKIPVPPPLPPPQVPKSWESLGIVDDSTLWNLRSGNFADSTKFLLKLSRDTMLNIQLGSDFPFTLNLSEQTTEKVFILNNLKTSKKFKGQANWRHRLKGVLQLEEALRSSENLARVQPCLDTLVRTLLSSECKNEVAEAKRNLLINLITRLPLDNLEDRTMQIMNGLCRQGGACANRVFKALMHRLPPASIFREHALQLVAYALMTFPSTCFDTKTCVTNATYAALNRKRRIRQAALDVLAVLGHITSIRNVLTIVEQIVNSRDDAAALVAAVKARLSRKLLPVITSDDGVKYTLHMPPTHLTDNYHSNNRDLDNYDNECAEDCKDQLGADIDWITAGIDSVSPTSLKRRAYPNSNCPQQSFSCFPTATVNKTNDSLLCKESYVQRFKWRPSVDNNVHSSKTKNYTNIIKQNSAIWSKNFGDALKTMPIIT
uniref:TOG domain-containing protein n=1 Tax=Glossina brevipalpis TaxID=37001 RepID=A0A1A9W0E6_9MUSC